jgi:hypothetical protein
MKEMKIRRIRKGEEGTKIQVGCVRKPAGISTCPTPFCSFFGTDRVGVIIFVESIEKLAC